MSIFQIIKFKKYLLFCTLHLNLACADVNFNKHPRSIERMECEAENSEAEIERCNKQINSVFEQQEIMNHERFQR